MAQEQRDTATWFTAVVAISGASVTALTLGILSLFTIGNVLQQSAWGALALLAIGLAASVAATILSVWMLGRITTQRPVSTRALLMQVVLVVAALIWSAMWLGDLGDWPFFGAAPLVYAVATAALVVPVLIGRRKS